MIVIIAITIIKPLFVVVAVVVAIAVVVVSAAAPRRWLCAAGGCGGFDVAAVPRTTIKIIAVVLAGACSKICA